MHIVFYARKAEPFSPASFYSRPRGGSESALYYLSRALATAQRLPQGVRSVEVTVLTHCGAEAGLYDGVNYLDLEADRDRWREELRRRPADVLVIFRDFADLLAPVPHRCKVFWVHDFQGVAENYPPSPLSRALAIGVRRLGGKVANRLFDLVCPVSRWAGEDFRWLFRTPPEKVWPTRNGINAQLFTTPEIERAAGERDPYRLIYTSVPERGLEHLLRFIFPRIRERVPQAKLYVCSYRPLDEYRRWIQEGVFFLGALPPQNLALELARSALLLHPSNYTETSCIAAIEAQAAGTPVVASAYGALPETVRDGRTGVIVPGRVETEEFNRRFAEAVVDLLLDPQREELGRAARQRALSYYSWDAIAQEWLAKLARLLQEKAAPFRRGGLLLSV